MDSLIKTGVQREHEAPVPSKKVPRWTKDEETTPTPETRSVFLKGSVIQQNMTNLASIGTRSTATPTTNSMTDEGSSQQLRSIQGKYWLKACTVSSRSSCRPET